MPRPSWNLLNGAFELGSIVDYVTYRRHGGIEEEDERGRGPFPNMSR